MSSKLRLNNLSLDHDDMEGDLYESQIESRYKNKASKPKRAKQDFTDYSDERSYKRRHTELLNG